MNGVKYIYEWYILIDFGVKYMYERFTSILDILDMESIKQG
jgi:hypothetical protein